MKTLGLLFTEGVSLSTWVSQGLISREKQIYEEHLHMGHFDKIIWFTYGSKDRAVYEKLISEGKLDPRIDVIPMPKFFIGGHLIRLYTFFLPYIQKEHCKELNIVKTNQMGGAWTAKIISRKYNIPFLLRTGYTYSSLFKNKLQKSKSSAEQKLLFKQYRFYEKVERKMYNSCDAATVSSYHDKEYICNSYKIPFNDITVIPNYIDCNLFKPCKPWISRKKRFIFVGRLSEEKNLYNTIQAIGTLGIGIDIYGKGELRKRLEEFASENQYDICFKGTVSNIELANIYSDYQYYILASPFEGMPKTLLEAMACGVLCFGTNTSGIKEIIEDSINGFLIPDTSVESIINTLRNGIAYDEPEKLAENAVRFVQQNNSLENITMKEWNLINRLI